MWAGDEKNVATTTPRAFHISILKVNAELTRSCVCGVSLGSLKTRRPLFNKKQKKKNRIAKQKAEMSNRAGLGLRLGPRGQGQMQCLFCIQFKKADLKHEVACSSKGELKKIKTLEHMYLGPKNCVQPQNCRDNLLPKFPQSYIRTKMYIAWRQVLLLSIIFVLFKRCDSYYLIIL